MRRFVVRLVCFFAVPMLLLVVLYVVADPYRTLGEFDPADIDETNREYFSVELFRRKNPEMQYNAFVFCSSRGGGLNSYVWRHLEGDSIRPFVFQSWAETIEGMAQKMSFLDRNGSHIEHALILLDYPASFDLDRDPGVNGLHHYLLTGDSKLGYNWQYFYRFAQKPSQWVTAARQWVKGERLTNLYDTVTNDRRATNRLFWNRLVEKDSLNSCSELSRNSFLSEAAHRKESDIVYGEPVIGARARGILEEMKRTMDRHNTHYKVIISPQYVYTNPMANESDVAILQEIFGAESVFNYSVDSEYTRDYNYYSDPKHFGLRLGMIMLLEVYGKQASLTPEVLAQ